MTFNITRVSKFCTKPTLFKNAVRLTKDRFPNMKRGSYAVINSTDVDYFKNILGDHHVITGEEVNSYNEDWLKSVCGENLKDQIIIFIILMIPSFLYRF